MRSIPSMQRAWWPRPRRQSSWRAIVTGTPKSQAHQSRRHTKVAGTPKSLHQSHGRMLLGGPGPWCQHRLEGPRPQPPTAGREAVGLPLSKDQAASHPPTFSPAGLSRAGIKPAYSGARRSRTRGRDGVAGWWGRQCPQEDAVADQLVGVAIAAPSFRISDGLLSHGGVMAIAQVRSRPTCQSSRRIRPLPNGGSGRMEWEIHPPHDRAGHRRRLPVTLAGVSGYHWT